MSMIYGHSLGQHLTIFMDRNGVSGISLRIIAEILFSVLLYPYWNT